MLKCVNSISALVSQFLSKAGRWAGQLSTSKLQPQHWRLSDTWVTLTRHHAEVITDAVEIEHEFALNCEHAEGGDAAM